MTQPTLEFSEPRRVKKRGHVPATSVSAYLESSRECRAAVVTQALLAMPNMTSAELAGWYFDDPAGERVDLSDLLYVRRGLSDALALGLVEHSGSRRCAVSGRVCLTWRLRGR